MGHAGLKTIISFKNENSALTATDAMPCCGAASLVEALFLRLRRLYG